MGSLVAGIFGMDSGTKQAKAGIKAGERYAEDVYFKPVTIASTLAGLTGSPEGEYSAALSPQLLGVQQESLGGAANLFKTLSDFDVGSVSRELYRQQYEMLAPTLKAQQIQAGEELFKTGTGGLMVSGEALGAPRGSGQINPLAYSLGVGQSQMLGDLAVKSRERAFGEAMQTGQLAAGLMGTAMGIEDMATKLMALGIDAQSARSAAAAAAGNLGTSGYSMATQAAMNQDQAMGSFWGGLFAGAGKAAAGGAFK